MEQPSHAEAAAELELGAEIGSGAIATVVRVHDRANGVHYAGKILHARHDRDEAAAERFRREAELASRLQHENLVTVHGIFEVAGRTAMLMELVEGHTLATHIARRGALPEPELVALTRGIAAGLAYAHDCGVVHRDLKPANVLLATAEHGPIPKIADFGMARAASFADADKRAMTVLGTPPYMAPECLEPLAVDPRTDLYALGCIVHEMATGAPPYGGPTPFAVLEAHRTAPIPDLPDSYGEGLRALATKLLAKSAGDRPQSAVSVIDQLDALTGTALARPVDVSALAAAEGRCAGCGAAVMRDVRLCFSCGLIQVALEPGPMSVFVVGPGRVSHKLDTERRDRLLRWLRANQAVGFDPAYLEKKIPRIPFPLIVGVSEASAATLIASLERLEIAAESRQGGRYAYNKIVHNALLMTGRSMTLVGAVIAAPALIHPFGLALLPVAAVIAPFVFVFALSSAGRPAVTNAAETRGALPAKLQTRLDSLHTVVTAIGERRYREELRAVVHRAVSLTRATPPREWASIDDEMAHAVNLAAVATRRMDELDREMQRPEFDPAEPHHRSLMQERDMWSARLLDLTAALDALAARRASADAAKAGAATGDALATLRATVESLEEVRRL